MNNIIEVNFKENEKKQYASGLIQWDRGQMLKVTGLDLEESCEVHFSLDETGGGAERTIGSITDKVLTATIPGFILEASATYDYNAYAFIYYSSATAGKTIKKIEFSIKARPKPEEWVDPEDPDTLGELLTEISKKVDKVKGKGLSTNNFTDELKEKLENISGITDEQLKNIDSITGKADKADVEGIQTNVAEIDKRTPRLIKKVTVEEDVASVAITKDEEGNPFELTDFEVRFSGSATTTQWYSIGQGEKYSSLNGTLNNGGLPFWNAGGYKNTYVKYVYSDANYYGFAFEQKHTSSASAGVIKPFDTTKCSKATSVIVQAISGGVLNSGSVIEVWGY